MPKQADTLTIPSFGTVTIYRGSSAPAQVVLFLSGDGGWNLGVVDMAQRLRDAGALVVGIDIRAFNKSLEAAGSCAYPAGALEELSRGVQLREKLPTYKRPILVGYSSGATLVYAAIAAAPPETFAGSVVPWMVLHGEMDQECGLSTARQFVAATGAARLFSLPQVGHGFGAPARWAPQFLEAFHAIAEKLGERTTATLAFLATSAL